MSPQNWGLGGLTSHVPPELGARGLDRSCLLSIEGLTIHVPPELGARGPEGTSARGQRAKEEPSKQNTQHENQN
jgi:hypothetical protein